MRSIWLLSLSNVRKKKIQNGFICLIITLSVTLLTTAMVVMNHTGDVFYDYHDKVKGSHQILHFNKGLHEPERIHEWWNKQTGVMTSDLMRYQVLSGVTHKGKENPNIQMLMMDTPATSFSVDELIFADGKEELVPTKGTVWIPTSLAYSNQISVGDKVQFKTDNSVLDLDVSAVVIDLPYGAPFSIEARIWMNPLDYEESFNTLQKTDNYTMSIRYDDYTQNTYYWDKFEEAQGTPFQELRTEFETTSAFYLVITKIVSIIMILLAFIMIIIALYTIIFTISDAILTSYKTIGIVKSLGLTSFQIVAVYVIQYTFLALLSVLPGIVVSYFFSHLVITSSLAYLNTKDLSLNISFMNLAVLISILVILVISVTAFVLSLKARSIQPAQAIRYGMSEKSSAKRARQVNNHGNHLLGLDKLPVTWMIGLRGILKNIRGSSLMIVMAMLTTSFLVFGSIFLYSIASVKETTGSWGYDSSDISVVLENKTEVSAEDFKKHLLSDPRVKHVGFVADLTGVIPKDLSLNEESMGLSVMAAEGNFDEIGFVNLEGSNPKKANEISLGVNVAKKYKKDIGDQLEMYIQGDKYQFIVSGIYQSIANMSNSARITVDTIRQVHPRFNEMDMGYINLNDGIGAEQFVQELKQKYGDAIFAATQESLLDEVFSQATTVMLIPLSIIGFLFIGVTFMIVYSICNINNKKDSRTYGIYKSIGMTSTQIRMGVTVGIVVLAGIGAVLGVPIGMYGMPLILGSVLADYGLIRLPLVIHVGGIVVTVLLCVFTGILASWLASRLIRSTSARNLSNESLSV